MNCSPVLLGALLLVLAALISVEGASVAEANSDAYVASVDANAMVKRYERLTEARNKKNTVSLIEYAVKVEGLKWDGLEVEAMARICWLESRYDPTLQNPRSTAFGMYQFLDSTWRGTKVKKTTDPLLQTIAGARYIKARYGTPRKALDFWDENHYY